MAFKACGLDKDRNKDFSTSSAPTVYLKGLMVLRPRLSDGSGDLASWVGVGEAWGATGGEIGVAVRGVNPCLGMCGT